MTGKTRAAHGTIVAYLALFVALSGTSAYAVDKIGSGGIQNNAVKTRHIGGGQVRLADVGAGAVNGTKVANNSLTGADINESTLGLGVLSGSTPGPDPESTRYVAPSGTTTQTLTSADLAAHLSPSVPTTVGNLSVSGTVSGNLIVTLVVDGADTAVACTIVGPATTCTDTTDSAHMPAGSRLAVKIQFGGFVPSNISFSMTVSPAVG